ncbi:MAG: dihydroneopterin aldolase [Actinobacteria bacterium]|nr:dihydroneopterin aldolase [Actinomycetota bacterium]NBT48205.1 dihydroneopterin aldolase [Actinomycetota bacterium]NBY44019.1 dihydroneopterin aldolase [Micrococcales bacterium]NDE88714.1 dihydroneopterin aldolase [Micrococcales bacterium]
MQHKIAIKGLRVFAHHGVFDFERQNGQDFYIDATVWIDGDKAAFSDDLRNTVHYGELAKGLVELTKNETVDLLETLAQRLLDFTFNFGGGIVNKAKVTVHKPSAPIPYEFEDVSVTVKAKRD